MYAHARTWVCIYVHLYMHIHANTHNTKRGTLKKETSVRFGIMLHGPFVFPPGTEPGSVVVYMNIGTASLMKPVCLSLSHWCSREEEGDNILKFLRAPHVPEAGNKYFFRDRDREAYFNWGGL